MSESSSRRQLGPRRPVAARPQARPDARSDARSDAWEKTTIDVLSRRDRRIAAPAKSAWRRFGEHFKTGRVLFLGDAVVAACFAGWWVQWTWPLLLGWLLTVTSYASSGLYRPRLHLTLLDQLPQLVSQFVVAMSVALTAPAMLGVGLELRRHVTGAALMIGGMLLARGLIFTAIRIGRSAGLVCHPTLILGGGAHAQKVLGVLSRHKTYGLNVVGYVADSPVHAEDPAGGWHYLGDFAALPRIVEKHEISVLLIDEMSVDRPRLLDGLRSRSSMPATFLLLRSWPLDSSRAIGDHIGGVPILRISRGWSLGQRFSKRLFDIVLAAALLILLAPLMLLVVAAILVEDRHDPIFKQVRVGRDGRLFTMYKLRSMRPVPADHSDTAWSDVAASRVGRVGRIIRATSIDELPQLFNILRGDMTFVGPRPERPHYVEQFSAIFPDYQSRHRVTVGLTGLAQVNGLRGDTSIDDRVRHDNYYIDHWSLWLDMKVLIWTFSQAFGARGS
ncbi:exopolysaccharide biosynthesis polyprenyl glycosylphosphotransferase [Actinoplanes sp. URMC 104]|uniref:exopolysaccharide biosynthesis polyprenyl glycosylphosphotransferase n=1 Tax=Actinoplanes sp. URMC 104 TaxID=3423409 RepID=UPI003F1AC84F